MRLRGQPGSMHVRDVRHRDPQAFRRHRRLPGGGRRRGDDPRRVLLPVRDWVAALPDVLRGAHPALCGGPARDPGGDRGTERGPAQGGEGRARGRRDRHADPGRHEHFSCRCRVEVVAGADGMLRADERARHHWRSHRPHEQDRCDPLRRSGVALSRPLARRLQRADLARACGDRGVGYFGRQGEGLSALRATGFGEGLFMVTRNLSRRLMLACALAACALVGPAAAQSYPDKPIKLVVPYPPGGPIDTTARVVAHEITERVGQVVVENRPGAGATLGARSVAAAEPDGYTLLFGSSGSLAVAPAARVALLPHVFVIAPSLPAKTVAEFVAHAKANPGKLNYGAAIGTPPHLLGTLFRVKAGIDIIYVPYRGSAQSVTDLLGGQTQMTIDGLTGLYPLVKDGRLRALAVASATRWPLLPDVPTLAESGFPDFVIDAWTGVVAPAGTPATIVTRLNAAINEGLKSAEAKRSLEKISAVARLGAPADFVAFLAAELPKWAEVVKVSGAKVD